LINRLIRRRTAKTFAVKGSYRCLRAGRVAGLRLFAMQELNDGFVQPRTRGLALEEISN